AVREELTEWVPRRFPGVAVTGERLGNLVVRMEDGTERIWKMADVYTAVAQLTGMGQDPAERARVYEQAAQGLFPPEALTAPLSLAAHGGRIKPRLVRPESLPGLVEGGEALHVPVPGLELDVVYVLDIPPGSRVLTFRDAADLGLDPAALHRTALENLRRHFP